MIVMMKYYIKISIDTTMMGKLKYRLRKIKLANLIQTQKSNGMKERIKLADK